MSGRSGTSISIGRARRCRHRSAPYLRSMCWLTDLLDEAPRRACGGLGPRVLLALGVGELALELAVALQPVLGRAAPSARAPRIAQPGSPACRQSLNRHCAASSAMSSNAVSTPSSAPATSSERIPGVSMSSAPPGSRTARDASSCGGRASRRSRTAAVACRASPRSALTSVDLPTPDDPSTTAVRPGRRWTAPGRSRWSPVSADTVTIGHARRDRLDRDPPALDVVADVGLVEHHDRASRRSTRRPRGSARGGAG